MSGFSFSGIVNRIIGGTNVTVDSTDPTAPVVSASGGGGGSDIAAGNGIIATDLGDNVIEIKTAVPISQILPTSSRYVRIDFDNPGGTQIRISNIAPFLGGVVVDFTASSADGSSASGSATWLEIIRQSIDVTYVQVSSSQAFVNIDFGAPIEFDSLRIVKPTGINTSAAVKTVKVSVSADGSTWQEIAADVGPNVPWDTGSTGTQTRYFAVPSDVETPLFITDAPQDGKTYARKDGAWIEITLP